MSRESLIILNQAIALNMLYQELSRLSGKKNIEIMHLTCANVSKVKSQQRDWTSCLRSSVPRAQLEEIDRQRYLKQTEIETSIIQDYQNDQNQQMSREAK